MDEEIPPADFAAVSLQHDGAFGRERLGAVPEVLHDGVIDDELVIQPHPGAGADLANAEAVPLAEVLVGDDGGIAAGGVRGVVEETA